MTTDTSWRNEAACRGKPTEWWFPDSAKAPGLVICRVCPVRTQCLDHALDLPEYHGTWGGTSERQRQSIRRRESAAHRRDLTRAS